MNWWWLSFGDATRPVGAQFLGAAIVGPAAHIGQALQLAHLLSINPGGEVAGQPIQDAELEYIPATHRDRLLTKEEALELVQALERPWRDRAPTDAEGGSS